MTVDTHLVFNLLSVVEAIACAQCRLPQENGVSPATIAELCEAVSVVESAARRFSAEVAQCAGGGEHHLAKTDNRNDDLRLG